jgi:hypothetical protein
MAGPQNSPGSIYTIRACNGWRNLRTTATAEKRHQSNLNSSTESPARTDKILNDISVHQNLLESLQMGKNRLGADTKMIAQNEREQPMKKQFLEHFDRVSRPGTASKVLLRFGRNHLHRGYDARGIATLGNFVAELSVMRGKNAFNLGVFGTGGKAARLGSNWDADKRQDEPAFALLAEKAKYPTTLFELRPLRALLHDIASEKRSETQRNLAYWAGSYDALICLPDGDAVATLKTRTDQSKPRSARSGAFVSLTRLHLALYSCTVAAFATPAASICPVAQKRSFL